MGRCEKPADGVRHDAVESCENLEIVAVVELPKQHEMHPRIQDCRNTNVDDDQLGAVIAHNKPEVTLVQIRVAVARLHSEIVPQFAENNREPDTDTLGAASQSALPLLVGHLSNIRGAHLRGTHLRNGVVVLVGVVSLAEDQRRDQCDGGPTKGTHNLVKVWRGVCKMINVDNLWTTQPAPHPNPVLTHRSGSWKPLLLIEGMNRGLWGQQEAKDSEEQRDAKK